MYLVSYDITPNRLRNKVAKTLEGFGKRVQYSVFECDLTEKRYEELYEKLLNHGILIRRCENYHNLTEEDYRVAVRTHEENERLLQAIKEVLAKSA